MRTALALAAVSRCSPPVAAAATDASPSRRSNLTFWTWVPNIDKVVAKWNAANPNIQVTVSKQARATNW